MSEPPPTMEPHRSPSPIRIFKIRNVAFVLIFAAMLVFVDSYRGPLDGPVFEATSGFGFLVNVYDPLDFIANAVGVGLAVVADLLTMPFIERPDPRTGRSTQLE